MKGPLGCKQTKVKVKWNPRRINTTYTQWKRRRSWSSSERKNQLMTFVLHGILTPISIQYTIVFVLMLSCDITTNKYAVYVNNTMCTILNAGVNAVLTNTLVFPLCSTYQCHKLETDCIWFMWCFLCRLRSIAGHWDNLVQRPSVCLCVCLSVR